MDLPYTMIVRKVKDESGEYYVAQVLEFDGCHAHGDTAEEAIRELRIVMELWIEAKLKRGLEIPEPAIDDRFSGRFLVRTPKSLHRKLVQQAKLEGVSLNQLVLYKLSQ